MAPFPFRLKLRTLLAGSDRQVLRCHRALAVGHRRIGLLRLNLLRLHGALAVLGAGVAGHIDRRRTHGEGTGADRDDEEKRHGHLLRWDAGENASRAPEVPWPTRDPSADCHDNALQPGPPASRLAALHAACY